MYYYQFLLLWECVRACGRGWRWVWCKRLVVTNPGRGGQPATHRAACGHIARRAAGLRVQHVRAVTDDGLLRNARVWPASAELQPYGIQAHSGLCAAVPTQTDFVFCAAGDYLGRGERVCRHK